jgi:excisionase family DNA binding protein
MKTTSGGDRVGSVVSAVDRAIEGLVELRRALDRYLTTSSGGELPDDFGDSLLLTPGRLEDTSVTVREAADILGLGEEQVRRLLRTGDLMGVPYGGRAGWRLSRAYVEEQAQNRSPRRRRTRENPRRAQEAAVTAGTGRHSILASSSATRANAS